MSDRNQATNSGAMWEPQTTRALHTLKSGVEEVYVLVDSLEKRLEIVMVPSPPTSIATGLEKEVEPMAPLAVSLQDITATNRQTLMRLKEILSHMEI